MLKKKSVLNEMNVGYDLWNEGKLTGDLPNDFKERMRVLEERWKAYGYIQALEFVLGAGKHEGMFQKMRRLENEK